MSTVAGPALSNAGLTVLSEEEDLFRASVREFAEGEVRPKVETMEHAGKLDGGLIKQCFELGLMAIESPEEFGGAGSTIFNAILAIEELARVDASVSVFVDVHNTLVTNAFMRWATDEQKKKYLTQLAEGRVGAYALSEAASGSDVREHVLRPWEGQNGFGLCHRMECDKYNESPCRHPLEAAVHPADESALRLGVDGVGVGRIHQHPKAVAAVQIFPT